MKKSNRACFLLFFASFMYVLLLFYLITVKYMQISDKMFGGVGKKSYLCTRNSEMSWLYRGVEQLVARQAHNLEVACSSPAAATMIG